MSHPRNWLSVTGLIAVTLIAVGWATPSSAVTFPACPSCRTTSLLLALAGNFESPGDPCGPAENVPLAGEVHVVTQIVGQVGVPPTGNFVTNVYLNMAGVQGTGQTSGDLYIGTGFQKFPGVQFPENPVFPSNPIHAIFTLEPTNGCASVPLPVEFRAVFGSDGTLLPQSTVSLGGIVP